MWFSPVDVLLAAFSPLLALYLRGAQVLFPFHATEVLIYVGISFTSSLIAFAAFRVYGGIPEYLSVHDVMETAKAVLAAELTTCAVMFAVTRLDGIPRSVPAIHALILGGGLFGARVFAHLAHKSRKRAEQPRNADARHVILIGVDDLSVLFTKFMESPAAGSQRVIALLDEDPRLIGRSLSGVRVFGPPAHLDMLIDEFAVHGVTTDRVVVGGAPDALSAAALPEIQRVCARRGIELSFLADAFKFAAPRPAQAEFAVACASEHRPAAVIPAPYFRYKRLIESLLAAMLIVASLPFWLVGGVLALFDVGQPILFWQRRIGLGGQPIQVYKFRTLRHAFDRSGHLIAEEERLSSIGRMLRRLRVDELPQLLGVLTGDMALIGPRPLLPQDQPADPSARLMVRPGISGWAQVNGGTLLTPEEKDALDAWYVRHASPWLDLRIMLLTLRSLIRGDRRSERALAQARRERSLSAADIAPLTQPGKPPRYAAAAIEAGRREQRGASVAQPL